MSMTITLHQTCQFITLIVNTSKQSFIHPIRSFMDQHLHADQPQSLIYDAVWCVGGWILVYTAVLGTKWWRWPYGSWWVSMARGFPVRQRCEGECGVLPSDCSGPSSRSRMLLNKHDMPAPFGPFKYDDSITNVVIWFLDRKSGL